MSDQFICVSYNIKELVCDIVIFMDEKSNKQNLISMTIIFTTMNIKTYYKIAWVEKQMES